MSLNVSIRHNYGLSLVELLVSMLVGVIILSGVTRVMMDSKDTFLMEQEVAYIQENIRFAQDELGYAIRSAGFFGCAAGVGDLTNTLRTSSTAWQFSADGIKGYEYGSVLIPSEYASGMLAGTDTVIVNYAETDDSLYVTSHQPSSAVVHVSDTPSTETGDILAMASPNCSNMAIFQQTGSTGGGSGIEQFGHSQSGGSVSPGNCSKALSNADGSGYDCTSPPSPSVTGVIFPPGSKVMKFKSSAYFIKNSPTTGVPSLYRQTLVRSGGTATTQAQELVSGVEDMEIIYGVDTTATTPDGIVDQYYSASSITLSEATAVSGWIGWDRVVSVRLTLIMRSNHEVHPSNTSVDLGDGYTFNDKYIRQKLTISSRIRNRGLEG